MKVALRWRANRWEKAPLLCRIFGHVWYEGWWSSHPYMKTTLAPVDHNGVRAMRIECKCWRCDVRSTIGHSSIKIAEEPKL